jgi:hypothetical protein
MKPSENVKYAGCTGRTMNNILIEIPAEPYDLFVAECDIKSWEYSTLKNGILTEAGDQRVIKILCDEKGAKMLLDAATRLYPAAMPVIKDALNLPAKEPG